MQIKVTLGNLFNNCSVSCGWKPVAALNLIPQGISQEPWKIFRLLTANLSNHLSTLVLALDLNVKNYCLLVVLDLIFIDHCESIHIQNSASAKLETNLENVFLIGLDHPTHITLFIELIISQYIFLMTSKQINKVSSQEYNKFLTGKNIF